MNAVFLKSFLTDVRKLKNNTLRRSVAGAITNVEASSSILEVKSCKRLSGHTDMYRIRLGDYRIGIKVAGVTVIFVRCLHRREVYRFFP